MEVGLDKKEAIKYLKEKLGEIHYLSKLRYNNTKYPIWLETIRGIVEQVFGRDSNEYQKLAKTYSPSGLVPQSSYKRILQKRAIALTSIIKTWEALGFENKHEVSESSDVLVEKNNWEAIEKEYGIIKRSFGRKINFVTDPFKRLIIFRDVEQAFVLASSGFSKPAVILAGGVIEELLRLYLEQKGISPQKPLKKDFNGYVQTCVQNRLLKDSVSHLSDSVRGFRNLVHLSAEETKKLTIYKSTAKGAVSSIFTIANEF